MKLIRAVSDTNVVVSAALSSQKGLAAQGRPSRGSRHSRAKEIRTFPERALRAACATASLILRIG